MKVKPFSGQGNYTIFNNVIIDHMMPELSATEWKVLTYIIRKTIGWHKESDSLSYGRIMGGTNLSRGTVHKALKGLLRRKYIILVDAPGDYVNANVYALNTGLEFVLPSANIEPPPSANIEPPPSIEFIHTKEKNINKDIPLDAQMVNALVDATGLSGHLNWSILKPLADKLLDAGYTAEQVSAVYGPDGYWYNQDWRGIKGDFPEPKHIQQTIKRGLLWNKNKRPGRRETTNKKQPLLKEFQKLVSRSPSYQEAKRRANPELWRVVKAAGRWADLTALNDKQLEIKFYQTYNEVFANA